MMDFRLSCLQISCPEVEHNVQQVDEIHEVVEAEPDEDCVPGDLGEGEPEDDHPEVVEEGQGHHHRPVVAEAARRVEHERPVTPAAKEERRKCVLM